MQIRIKIQGVSDADTLKLNKIFQLSVNRHKKYCLVEDKADLLITASSAYKAVSDIPTITLGASADFPNSKVHIKPPLLAIRVLKVLDAVEFLQQATKSVATPQTEPELVIESKEINEAQNVTIDADQNAYDILVVDDSKLIHKALDLELRKAEFGTNITFVESGEQCLDAVKDKKFDLVFLDVMMPGIDGYQTCTEIRKNTLYKKTPIIMLSSKTSPLDEVKGVMAGCTTYLTKPIQHKEFQKLLMRMDKWLENFSPIKSIS